MAVDEGSGAAGAIDDLAEYHLDAYDDDVEEQGTLVAWSALDTC